MVVSRSQLSQTHQAALRGEGPEHLVSAWAGRGTDDHVIVGVLDIDCESQNGFDAVDADALQRLVQRIVQACDWCIE